MEAQGPPPPPPGNPPPPPGQQPPAAAPGPPAPPPGPPIGGPVGTTRDDDKASTGLRIGGILLALVAAFAAAVMIVAAIDIGDTIPCENTAELLASGDFECFDGSSTEKTISLILMWPGGVIIGIAALLGLMFGIRGRGGRKFLLACAVGLVLSGLGILVGSI